MSTQRARIYARVSSQRQASDGTIGNQIGKSSPTMRWLAQQRELELTGIYTDDGKSASAGKLHLRGDFNKMLIEAARHDFDVLVVAGLDRITRTNDWGELGQIFGPLQKAGISIWGPNLPRPIDLRSTASWLELVMRLTVAYEDNAERMRKLKGGKERQAQLGGLPAGPPPYGLVWQLGYRCREEDPRPSPGWSIHPEKGPLAREIFERAAKGETGHSIGQDFEARDIPGPNGGRWKLGIIRILRSSAYRGEWAWKGIPIKVPALVDNETWYAAQAALGVSRMKGLAQPKHHYLVDKLGVCKKCNAPLYVLGSEGPYRYYVCLNRTARRAPGIEKCPMERIRADVMDAGVWSLILAFFAQPKKVILEKLHALREDASAEAAAWASDVEQLSGKLDHLAAVEETIMDSLIQGTASKAVYQERMAKLAQQRKRLQEQLEVARAAKDKLASANATTDGIARLVDELKVKVPKATPKQQRELVRFLVPKGGVLLDRNEDVTVRMYFDETGASEKTDFEGTLPERVVTLRVAR